MTFRCVFGLLNLVVVFAHMSPARQNLLKLQKSTDTVENCEGAGCSEESPANQSVLELREMSTDEFVSFDLSGRKQIPTVHRVIVGNPADYADVDAWLIMCHQSQQISLQLNMFTPILETVRVGVESAGGKVKVIGLLDMGPMLKAVKAAAAAGKRPMVFAVAYWYAPLEGEVFQVMRDARASGAYTVLYQSEQMPRGKKLSRALGTVNATNVHEVWEYSRANLAHYPPIDGVIARYVPPGYVATLDTGVDMNSPLKKPEFVGYMGHVGKPMVGKYLDLFGGIDGHLSMSNHVWGPDELREFLETYPLQLNQHKDQTCCPREEWEAEWQHVEAFRMSVLLSNKCCVMSAPSADLEMKQWEGLVNFVEVEDTVKKAAELWHNLDRCRISSYEKFKREYAPELLLQRSGLFNDWTPRKSSK